MYQDISVLSSYPISHFYYVSLKCNIYPFEHRCITIISSRSHYFFDIDEKEKKCYPVLLHWKGNEVRIKRYRFLHDLLKTKLTNSILKISVGAWLFVHHENNLSFNAILLWQAYVMKVMYHGKLANSYCCNHQKMWKKTTGYRERTYSFFICFERELCVAGSTLSSN